MTARLLDTATRSMVNQVLPVIAANSDEADRTGCLPIDNVRSLRESGLLGLLVPAEHGGVGGEMYEMARVAVDLAGACASTAMVWTMHCQQVDAIVRHADPKLRSAILHRVASGEILLGSVTTDSTTGGHLLSMPQSLRDEEDGTISFERSCPIVTAAHHADAFLVTMREPDGPRSGSLSLVFVERSAADVRVFGQWDATGMRGTESLAVEISASVEPTAVIGGRGGFRGVLVDSFAVSAHIGWSAAWLGAARGAARELIGTLRTSGDSLSSDLSAARLGRARGDLEVCAALLESVIGLVTHARATGGSLESAATQIRINVLKVSSASMLFRVVDELVELAGLFRGYTRDGSPALERAFRDLRSASLNYRNDRLLAINGRLALVDRLVSLGSLTGSSEAPAPPHT